MTEEIKNPVGAPTKYKGQETIDLAYQYIDNFNSKYKHAIPMRSGLSIVLGVSRETLNQWDKDIEKKEFSDALKKLDSVQELMLASKGLLGEYNSTITKLMLSNNHGYAEKKEESHKFPDGHPMDSLKFEVIKPKDE